MVLTQKIVRKQQNIAKRRKNPFRKFFVMYNKGLKTMKKPILPPDEFIEFIMIPQKRHEIGKILMGGGMTERQMDYLLDLIAKKHYVHKIPNLMDSRMVKLQLLTRNTRPLRCSVKSHNGNDCPPMHDDYINATETLIEV